MTDFEGSVGTRELAARLEQVPESARTAVRKALRKTGQGVLVTARSNASWSTRIPGAISLQTRFTGKFPGVVVVASAARAPHARPYEGITSRGDSFRHPVYGNREVWVAQACRPFLRPAVREAGPGLPEALAAAVDQGINAAGL